LYKNLGFLQLSVRKHYYEDNGEDALLMVCDHMPPVDQEFSEGDGLPPEETSER
jgi:[ribosomal protein S18]-alanine N-acetyltransferase